jgi:glycosyltransferase involved in cell wall biosynthesis
LLKKYPVKHIDIVGHVPQDQLKSYLSSSDVYLFPSLAEGCASSAMEAMAAGLPVIVTNESGLPVIDGRDGLKIPSMSVHHIVESIYRLDNDIKLRKILGENAANTIAEKYSWDLYAQKVTGIYKEVLKIEE